MRTNLLLLLALPVLLATGGCGRKPWPGEPDPVVIRNRDHYFQVWGEVQKETERPLLRYETNEPLSGDDMHLLEQAHPKILGLIKDKPQSFPPRVIYAKLLRASNAPERALPAYLEALAVAPENPPADFRMIMAECHADIAEIYFAKKQLGEAEAELRKALKLSPQTVKFMLSLVQVLLEDGQKEAAKSVYQEAKKLAPASAGVKSLGQLFESL